MKGYTIFELQEFVGLQSKYAKNLYRILKQWRTTGEFVFYNIDNLRLKLDVPDSYANKRLMEKVIKPAVIEIQELDKSFENFNCEPLYLHKSGKPLAGYKFTWKPESRKDGPDKGQAEKKQDFNNKKALNRYNSFPQRTYNYD